MKVLINDIKTITIDDPDIKVKDGKLYNSKTKLFEGVQGDTVWFLVEKNGTFVSTRGIVDGYTNDRKVKLMGKKEPYTTYNEHKKIEHLSIVKLVDEEEELLAATMAL